MFRSNRGIEDKIDLIYQMIDNMGEKNFSVFIVEDNEWYNKFLLHHLSLNPDYEVKSFFSGKELLKNMHLLPDVVTLDYKLPDFDGAKLLKEIKAISPDTEVIVISEQNEIEVAINLLKEGAYDYIVKADDIRDRLLNVVQNIGKNHKLQEKVIKLEKEVQKKYDFQKTVIGNSKGIHKIYELIEKSLSTSINVMISGETGTGKEVVAKAIHYNSPRKNRPFVAVNVTALPADLIESELFGHEKGSFTGAMARRLGKFEEADGGTLFLDEIGELDISFQAKLLRALQEREVTRVGSNTPVKIDCRIITATNKNLMDQVKNGKFREDLYYRLIGLPIELPPLREREKDILVLAKYFVDEFCKENKMETKSFSEDAKNKLLSYTFPGNIRELKSLVELGVVLSTSGEIKADDISIASFDPLPEMMKEEFTMRQYELRILKSYLIKYNDDVKKVAEKLDISSATIYRMLKE
jgi:two-component system response regulator AtoC